MNDPPDPGDFVPPAGNFVTIQSNESGMETDGSTSTRSLKRRMHVCKHCNKRRRRHIGTDSVGCGCQDPQSFSENISNNNPKNPVPVTPQTSIGRKNYEKTDSAPYVIHVQKEVTSPNDGTTLHPITFGKFLKKHSFTNIINGSVKRIGRNKISMAFSNHTDANNFLTNKSLEAQNLKAYIPTFNVTRMGLVRGVPAEWSPEEIGENISVPLGCGPIIKVRRINFKTFIDGAITWKPTQSVVVTFDGQILPKRIFICYNSLPVDLYIFPTIQCYNCCRYGHTKLQCRSKPRCFKCGQGHTGDSCDVDEDHASCCMCSGYHFASNKSCPEFDRQKKIKTYMAQNSVSYAEAMKVHPPVGRTYAETLLSSPSKNFSNKPVVISNRIPNTTTSYKKTIFMKPRSPPKTTQGYDIEAHKNIIKDFQEPQPSNGCALTINENMNKNETNSNMSINDFITAFLQLLSQFNISPSNAASFLNTFTLPTNHGLHNTVELSQPIEQKK